MFDLDFSNVTHDEPPNVEGVYKVRVTGVDSYTTKAGNARITFTTVITEGPFENYTIKDGINLPTKQQDNKKWWVRMLRAFGRSREEINQMFSVKAETLKEAQHIIHDAMVDLESYCHYRPAVGDEVYPHRSWLSEARAKATAGSLANSAPEGGDPLDQFLNA